MKEDEVYIATKKFLIQKGWMMLAGQPPNGCNHLPVVEIKQLGRAGIGSKGAYKPDLIAAKQNVFLLIECKPAYNQNDAEKLNAILSNADRMNALFSELTQRHIFERHKIIVAQNDFKKNTLGALAYEELEKGRRTPADTNPGTNSGPVLCHPNSIRDSGAEIERYQKGGSLSTSQKNPLVEITLNQLYKNSKLTPPKNIPTYLLDVLNS